MFGHGERFFYFSKKRVGNLEELLYNKNTQGKGSSIFKGG
jgi:hypothetical protein